MKRRITRSLLVTLGVAAIVAVACGGGDDDGGSSGAPPTAPPASASQQPAAPRPTSTPPPVDETGLLLENIQLEGKGLGGRLTASVTNNASELCRGAVISFDLVREDGSVAGSLGIQAHNLEPGETRTISELYYGKGVDRATVTETTCESSIYLDDEAPGIREEEETPAAGK